MSTTESPNMVRRVRPAYMAHFVIRTSQYEEVIRWYQNFLDADIIFTSDFITFMTFDEEHHRLAIGNLPNLAEHDENSAGVDHLAFSFLSLGDLVFTYERLKEVGITPYWCVNHGPCTSMYFRDPDGVQVEYQVDNIVPGGHAPKSVFQTKAFAENPVGLDFDPEVLAEKYHAGVPAEELLKPDTVPG